MKNQLVENSRPNLNNAMMFYSEWVHGRSTRVCSTTTMTLSQARPVFSVIKTARTKNQIHAVAPQTGAHNAETN